MSEVLPGQIISPLFESSYSFHRPQVISSSLVGTTESQIAKRRRTDSRREASNSTSSMDDSQRRGIYDTPSNRSDDYQRRHSLSQRKPREQLPPLSSIFQNSHTALPVRAPAIRPPERSPNFAAVSPRTNIRTPARPGEDHHYPEASYENRNYVQPTHPPPYPFDRRSEEAAIQHPPRSLSSSSTHGNGLSQPVEPRYTTGNSGRAPLGSGFHWSPRASDSSPEYFSRPHQNNPTLIKAYPDVRHQQPLAPPGRSSDSKHISPQLAHYQLGSSGVNHSEPSSTKDSLGPKIWTGTQFLPRFVKQQEVPGEGLCYFYDDGSHCKTVIDGEAVNAHWGVTKAGKPRKRLAIACITCREKKIKCDPDYPRCVQCEKFGRVCKFKNAPRGTNHVSPETTSPTEAEDFMDHESTVSSTSQRADAEQQKFEKMEIDSNHSKRRKNTFTAFTPVKAENEGAFGPSGNEGFRHPSNASESSAYSDNLINTWYTDPYEANPTLTDHLITKYLLHINTGPYCMFPETAFMAWLRKPSEKKSPDDNMLLYSMLALGSVFSTLVEHRERGKEFARISRYAVEHGHGPFSLQLVQSRLILSLYLFATGDEDGSWDFCGGAIRAATGTALSLNVESEEMEDSRADFPYDLNRHGYAECRRRTFWSLYIMDRFNCHGASRGINSEDVYLRLPYDSHSYKVQIENTNPYFDTSAPTTVSSNTSKLGPMAYLIMMSSIFGDVMTNIYRTSARPDQLSPVSKIAYTNFHNAITKRLETWEASLPPTLQYSTVNLDRSMHEGNLCMFVTIHSTFHATQLRLNRYHRTTDVSPSQLERNIRKAYTSAREILALTDVLADRLTMGQQRLSKSNTESGMLTNTTPPNPEFSNPYLGYAIITAVDLITSKGRKHETPNLLQVLSGARFMLKQLENFWNSAKRSSEQLEQRINELEQIVRWHGERMVEGVGIDTIVTGDGRGGVGVWEMEESLERGFGKGLDGVYKATWSIWLRATEGCKTLE